MEPAITYGDISCPCELPRSLRMQFVALHASNCNALKQGGLVNNSYTNTAPLSAEETNLEYLAKYPVFIFGGVGLMVLSRL